MKSLNDMPIAGNDYPTTWCQFLDWFHSEEACRTYLENLRWPTEFVCPKCQVTGNTKQSSRGWWVCCVCKYQCTVTAGTVFDKTRTELRVWFAAIWYITNQKQGVSALGLQRVLGLGSYETAWTMLHRLRRAMVRPARQLLTGEVEVDKSYLALTDREKTLDKQGKKSSTTKILVAIAVEIKEPKGFGRIRIQQIDKGDTENLLSFIRGSVDLDASIHSDGSGAYLKLQKEGYGHQRTIHLGSDIPAHETMPGVHRVAALLQRWLLGNHGAIKPKQLDSYLNEFVFRFNRRNSKSRGLLFYRLIQQAIGTQPITYKTVITCTKK